MASEQQIARKLDEVFGITVPAPFVRLVGLAAGYDARHGADEFYGIIFEFGAAGAGLRNSTRRPPSGSPVTPPEFLEFGGPGVDGIRYGFVVHAPELHQTDYPLGELRPTPDDRAGVYRLGDDTRSGLEFLMSRTLHDWADDTDLDAVAAFYRDKGRSDVAAIATEIGVTPTPAKGNRPPDRIRPAVPPQWRYLPSADGVGVLAPQDAFTDRPPTAANPAAAVDEARSMIRDGYPATALLGIRNTFWRHRTSRKTFDALKDTWADAYHELDRPLFAAALAWKRP